MLQKVISLNEKISKMPHLVKGINLFSNGYYMLTTEGHRTAHDPLLHFWQGYYMLTTEGRRTGTDADVVDFKTMCSDQHVILDHLSYRMTEAFRFGQTNIFMVISATAEQMFERTVWNSDDKILFENEFMGQNEYDLDKKFTKIGFDSIDGERFIVGDLKSGNIIENVPIKRGNDTVKKHKLDLYFNGLKPSTARQVFPDFFQKPRVGLESTVKQGFPYAITASNQGYFCASYHNLFYYFDLSALDVLYAALKSFQPARDDDIGRHYAENYSKMLTLVQKRLSPQKGQTRR
jgi:hypothetical protein